MDTLSFADCRGVGENSGTQGGGFGDLYRAWISFLSRGAAAKLAAVLSSGKIAYALDRQAVDVLGMILRFAADFGFRNTHWCCCPLGN